MAALTTASNATAAPRRDSNQMISERRGSGDRQIYNQNGNVQVLGYSTLTDSEMMNLTEAEKQAIGN